MGIIERWKHIRRKDKAGYGGEVSMSGKSQDMLEKPGCDAVTLVRILLRAGIEIDDVEYEEDADVGMKYFGGTVSAEEFIKDYNWIRKQGMGGMFYSMQCRNDGALFKIGCADNEYGKPYGRIVITGEVDKEKIFKLIEDNS